MLKQFLVHSIHVSYDAVGLNSCNSTLLFRWTFYCFIWLASIKILDSICLSHPRSNDLLFSSSYFFYKIAINSAYFNLWSSLTLHISELNSALSTIISLRRHESLTSVISVICDFNFYYISSRINLSFLSYL